MAPSSLRVKFIVAWGLLLLAKLWLAMTLQPFGDEAFYALESRRLAWAYSDLPGLTAWMIRVGTEVGGQHPLAMRSMFLLLGSALPWLVVRIARRWFGNDMGWRAGLLALLMPLSGLMGVLALPDVPMLLASLLCLDAFARLLERVGPAGWAQLALGLALGAFSHYRFVLVIAAGLVGLLCVARGRALLREPGLWLAVALGAAAWLPLLAWNLGHAGAGLEFQFVDRHPWGQLQPAGLWWPLVQALVVTPGLFVLLLATLVACGRRRAAAPAWALLLGLGLVSVVGYFALGFLADSERVSFHWPLAGWLALACAAPVVLDGWRPWARRLVYGGAALGLVAMIVYLVLVALPQGRSWLASGPAYADNFSGWQEVAQAVDEELATLPDDTRLVADNFMLGAQLAFARDQGDIAVLEHPLNAKHGRAVQLSDWGLLSRGRADWGAGPVLLVVEDSARPLKSRLQAYRDLCDRTGGLPAARVLPVDQGRKRFLLFRLDAPGQACVMPALAWLDAPLPGQAVAGEITLRGWALAEGSDVVRVDVTLDGTVVAVADYGKPRPDVLDYWGIRDADAGVGFEAQVDLSGRAPGRAWLGLVLHTADGRREPWPAQAVTIR
ncbi:glycosyltransferase family 39 protein [Arenimonas sp. MALMAid1274]|uniref:glycosyltransferase family 39 protein n=1 Tax=Arenimonas sp. MALMAid1274 TaxID=3411630 RepID=UPI003BA169ED